MNLPLIDWIWRVRGSLPLTPGQSSKTVFDKLDPLFRQTGTTHQVMNDTLTFAKKHQAAQDKMSVFDGGSLWIDRGPAGPVLRYNLLSRALLFCLLAPVLFISIAQFTIYLNKIEKPPVEAAKKADMSKKAAPMNPVDKFLHAPAPDNSKKDAAPKGKKGKPSPTPAYVFATFFAILYVVGRILEAWLVKRLFKKSLDEGEGFLDANSASAVLNN